MSSWFYWYATLLNDSAICLCPTGMIDNRCDQTIRSSFCSSSSSSSSSYCRNNGTCIGAIYMYMSEC
ncbi:unnamed protein product [Rotaria sp. Silwood2]|nr:unnamed protein product [Rotaria sp. Silwood2]CAF2891119.1 unnamed protein product [Rotaria sp. Silwood2]CAF4412567.1 unnamed protein product [Rotaria sp. Silwood2]CAF4658417.1 unnamed protein product [Rotaria sp. Silwood2]